MTPTDLQNKKVAILGYGQEGQAVLRYLVKHGIKPVLFDQQESDKFPTTLIQELDAQGIRQILGPECLDELEGFDVAFRSPGLWRLTPELLKAEKTGLLITSQIIFFMSQWRNRVIGITGTKGKGTTSALIYHIVNEGIKRSQFRSHTMITDHSQVYLTGNIGKIQPLDIIDELKPDDIIIYEMSSFQLQDLHFSPTIGVILMITSEHLDHHASMAEYQTAKSSIAAYQGPKDTIIVNADFPASENVGKLSKGNRLYFSAEHSVDMGGFINNNQIIITDLSVAKTHSFSVPTDTVPLKGVHNSTNATAAILASLIAGVSESSIEKAISTFVGLPHRLQLITGPKDIEFYDDSFATVPENTIAALNSFTQPVILILGGSDKGADLSPLTKQIAQHSNIKSVFLVGTVMAPKIKALLQHNNYTGLTKDGFADLESAMKEIKTIVKPGDIVLLSPACASFDSYTNYVERGDHFQTLVREWAKL